MTSSKSVPAILQQHQDKEPQGTRRGAIIWQYGALEEGTISGFIVSSALGNAEKAIQKHETMALDRRDAKRFFDAIVNPPAPNDKLRAAMDEHRKRVASR